MRKSLLPMKLQFFAEDGGAAQSEGSNQQLQEQQGAASPAFDYEKLASIINGKQAVTEDTVLKNYFKQQGLSQDEVTQAIQSFKNEKAKNQPDVMAIQNQLLEVQAVAEKAELERMATLEAVTLGIDAKIMPYVLKMADLSNVKGNEGKVSQEAVKSALSKVLEDIPQLKPAQNSNQGFQIGGGSSEQNNKATEDALKAAFGL